MHERSRYCVACANYLRADLGDKHLREKANWKNVGFTVVHGASLYFDVYGVGG